MVFLMPSYISNLNSRRTMSFSRNNQRISNLNVTNRARNNIRSDFQINTGYNRPRNSRQASQTRQTRQTPSSPRTPSTLSFHYLNSLIDVSANNISRYNNVQSSTNQENENYQSSFIYGGLDIQFYHNVLLSQTNVEEFVISVLNNINYQEITNIMDEINDDFTNFISDSENSESLEEREQQIKLIESNITTGAYKTYKKIIKNDICPITLSNFQEEDIIAFFHHCYHAIDASTKTKFVNTFTKCPLCNQILF